MPVLRGQRLVGMGLCVTMSPTQTAFYIILILLGITVNTTVVGVIGENVFKDPTTTSMVIHKTVPIMLMAINNLSSLYTLYAHSRTRYPTHMTTDAPALKRVPSERRAAKVIPALIMLFNGSWGTSLISINYFNYNQGLSAEFLLVTARFANTIFNAISPIVLAVGHRRLRAVIKSILTH
uniref:G-protein coupled receptors family 1 profile domain-containing protein n=1 Tax=Oncorhynchus mykiss TaxID=8022 RepID=A0A8C7RA15_ONCMY